MYGTGSQPGPSKTVPESCLTIFYGYKFCKYSSFVRQVVFVWGNVLAFIVAFRHPGKLQTTRTQPSQASWKHRLHAWGLLDGSLHTALIFLPQTGKTWRRTVQLNAEVRQWKCLGFSLALVCSSQKPWLGLWCKGVASRLSAGVTSAAAVHLCAQGHTVRGAAWLAQRQEQNDKNFLKYFLPYSITCTLCSQAITGGIPEWQLTEGG